MAGQWRETAHLQNRISQKSLKRTEEGKQKRNEHVSMRHEQGLRTDASFEAIEWLLDRHMPNKCQKRSQTGIMMFSIGLHAQLFAVYCLCIPRRRNFRQAFTTTVSSL